MDRFRIFRIVAVFAVAIVPIVVGCGDDEPRGGDNAAENDIDNDEQNDDTSCTPGESISCECSDGRQGTQTCGDGGDSFSTCECPDNGDDAVEAPTGLTATEGDFEDRVELHWDSVDGADEYRVYRDNVRIVTVDHTSYDDEGADEGGVPHAPEPTATDGEFEDRVEITWDEPTVESGTTHSYEVVAAGDAGTSDTSNSAEGYRSGSPVDAYRLRIDDTDWIDVGDTTDYDDTSAEAGSVPTAPSATASDGDFEDRVDVSWDEPDVEPGAPHHYEVVALNDAGTGEVSEPAQGYRDGPPVTSYEVEIDGNQWVDAGDTTSFEDSDVPPPQIDAGDPSASQGDYSNYVELQVADSATTPGEASTYRVRAINDAGNGQASDQVSGTTELDSALQFQWQRSDGDNDANYSDIPSATSSSYNDTDAPDDGAGRYYRVVVSAEANPSISGTSDGVRGFRAIQSQVATDPATDVGATSASLHGEIATLGAPEPTNHGFCYGTSPDPEIGDATCPDLGAVSSTGSYSLSADGLEDGTTYYVRSFVTQPPFDTVYGEGFEFTTSDCTTGSIDGLSCAPDESPWPNAEITLEGTDCDDNNFEYTTEADTDGSFQFDDIDSGDHQLSVESGSFELSDQSVSVAGGETTDLTISGEPLCLEGDEVEIAVIDGQYAHISEFLDDLEFDYSFYEAGSFGFDYSDILNLLEVYSALSSYDILIVDNGAPWKDEMTNGDYDTIEDNLDSFVDDGNSILASDYGTDYIADSIPDAFNFNTDGASTPTLDADILNSDLEDLVGSSTANLNFGIAAWYFIDSPGTDTTIDLEGDVDMSDDPSVDDAGLMGTYDPVDEGRVIATSVYYDASDVTDDMLDILRFSLFEL